MQISPLTRTCFQNRFIKSQLQILLHFARAIADATSRRVSTVSFVESAVVIDASRDPIATRRFDDFIQQAHISIEPLTAMQAQIAREAYRDFGKGSGHPAKLNLGDCFAYALAKQCGEPLLFKGDDFPHTDVVPVLKTA